MVDREHDLLRKMFAAANFCESGRQARLMSGLPMTPCGLRRPQHLAGCGGDAREGTCHSFGN